MCGSTRGVVASDSGVRSHVHPVHVVKGLTDPPVAVSPLEQIIETVSTNAPD